MPSPPPLIVHVIHRLDVGGLENGLVNLLNHMPASRFRHAIVALTVATQFRERLEREIPIYELNKREGHDLGLYLRLWRLLRELKPQLVHSRNMAALEGALVAWAAGVPQRVHGEHGWDVLDLDGSNRRYRLLRRLIRPFVGHYITVSKHLEQFLQRSVGVDRDRVTQIYNGVSHDRFVPRGEAAREPIEGVSIGAEELLIGSVGRMAAVKDQLTLVRAFLLLRERRADLAARLRLVLIGDGPLRAQAEALLSEAGAAERAWLPGSRDDVPQLLRQLDLFILPSLNEGISNTILEAMASGLPIVATEVGGNPELVQPDWGALVPPSDPAAMAAAIERYIDDEPLRRRHGNAARQRIEARFSWAAMVDNYCAVYERLLEKS